MPWTALRGLFLSHAHTDHILGGVWAVRAVGHAVLAGTYRGDFPVYAHPGLLRDLRQICRAVLPPKLSALLDGGPIRLVPVADGEERETPFGRMAFFDTGCESIRQFGCALRGAGLVYLGDEPIRPAAAPYVRGCEWLIAEALCLYEEREIHRPYEAFHSTVKDACQRAQALGVRRLVLSHTEDTHLSDRKALYTREGLRYFHGSLFVPDDREIIPLA